MRAGRNLLSLLGLLVLTVGAANAQEADLLVAKSGPEFAAAGSDVTYQLTLTNIGPDDAVAPDLADPLPAGMTFVSITQTSGPVFACTDPGVGNNGTVNCGIGQLNAGQTAQFDLVVNIPMGTPMGTTFTNIASVSSMTFDPNAKNDSAPAATTVPAIIADVAVIKTGPDAAGPDTDVEYTIAVRNNGPDAADSFAVSDSLPATMTFVSLVQTSGPALSCTTPAVGANGMINCSALSFANGANATLTLTAHIPPGTPSGTDFTNTATVFSTTTDNDTDNNEASSTLTVSTVDLAVTKAGPATAAAGSTVSYTLTLTNNGPDAALSVDFSDPLPPGTTFVSMTQNTGPAITCVSPPVGASGTVLCSTTLLASGASAQFTLVVATPADTPNGTMVSNTATADSSSFDTANGNDSASASTTITNTADVTVTKTAPATVNAGQNLTYTIVFGNGGPDVAANASLTDLLPPGTTFVSLGQTGTALSCTTPAVGATGTVTCSAVTLASGASTTLTLVVALDAAAVDGSAVMNTATVATTSPESSAVNNSATATSTVVNQADLGVVKAGPATAVAGANVTYTITATNAGPLSDAATLTDALPANTTFVSLTQTAGPTFNCTTPAVGGTGTVTCSNAAFASGGSATFSLVLAVGSGLANGTSLVNTAAIDGGRVDPNAANDTSMATSTVSNIADVAVGKTGGATVIAGQNVTYALTASNDGASPALTVALGDLLPPNTTFVSFTQNSGPAFSCTTPAVGAAGTVSCTIASLASLTSATFTLVVQASPAAPNGSTITNTATIATTSTEATAANNSASTTATVTNTADLSVTKTAPAAIVAGQNITYALGVANAGPVAANTVQLSDVLPAGATFVSLTQTAGTAFSCVTPAVGAGGTVTCSAASLASGANATFSLVVAVPAAAGNGTSFANTATVTSATVDPVPANDSATSTATVNNTADVSVTKTGPAAIVAGQNITYTLGVANAGPATANTVQLSDTLPGGATFVSLSQTAGPAFTCVTPAVGAGGTVTCSAATLASGASAAFSLVVAVPAAAANGTSFANTATVTSASVDPTPANGTATSTATVNNTVDLSLTKTGPGNAIPGQTIEYALGVSNAGPAAAVNVVVTDPLPAQTTFVSLTQNSGPAFTCATPAVGANGTVTCDRTSLAAGATATFTLAVRVVPGATGSVANTASATSGSVDIGGANNAATSNATIGLVVLVPTLSMTWLALLALALAVVATTHARRRTRG